MVDLLDRTMVGLWEQMWDRVMDFPLDQAMVGLWGQRWDRAMVDL